MCSLYFLIGTSGHLLSLSRTTTICFSANAALENLRISSFDFQIQTVPNSFLGRKKLLRNVGTGCKGSSIYCSSSGDGDAGPPMPYSFDFNVADEESQVYHARQEESDGETVVGSYSYVDPTGALIIVNYRQVLRW